MVEHHDFLPFENGWSEFQEWDLFGKPPWVPYETSTPPGGGICDRSWEGILLHLVDHTLQNAIVESDDG